MAPRKRWQPPTLEVKQTTLVIGMPSFIPTVTVITRTRDRPVLLERAIKSVLAQTFTEWELLIVNDGGEASATETVVQKCIEVAETRAIKLHHLPASKGRAAAANVGLKAAQGEFFVLLDDDDSWHPDFLQRTVRAFRESNQASIKGVATRSTSVYERVVNGRIEELFRCPFNPDLTEVTLFRMAGGAGGYLCTNAVLYETRLRELVGLFDENLPVVEDWEFHLRVLRKFDIRVVTEALAFYHHRRDRRSECRNSIFDAETTHRHCHTAVLNDALRADLDKQEFGMGWLMNISRSQLEMERRILTVSADQGLVGLTRRLARRVRGAISRRSKPF